MTPPKAGELDVFKQNAALGRGINLGNALDAPTEGSWGPALKPYMFQVAQDEGFDSIRLPVKWSAHALKEAPYTIDASFFDRVDWAVAHAISRGLKIVVDMHHYGNTDEEGMFDQPVKHHERFLALWTQIAEHYKDYPKELYLEILNEPRDALEAYWNDYMAEAVAIIRKTNPGRTLVVGGGEWNKYYKLSSVVFPDTNIIATFHYYNPYCFTHQNQFWEQMCKTPDGSDPTKAGIAGWPVIWPKLDKTPDTTETTVRAKLDSDMRAAAAWSKTANRPLYMGEFGVSSSPAIEERADWTASAVKLADELGISFAYWQFTSDMGAWDGYKMAFIPEMLEALKTKADTQGNTGGAGGAEAGGASGSGGTTNANGGTAGQVTTNTNGNAGSSSGGASSGT
jgi:endoglucanase